MDQEQTTPSFNFTPFVYNQVGTPYQLYIANETGNSPSHQPPPVIPDSGGLYTANVGQPGVYPEQLESRLCSICCAPISESGTCVSQHCLGIDQPVFGIGNLAVLPAPSDVDSGSELCSAAPLQYPVLNYSHRRLRSGHKLTRCTTCHTNPPDTKFKTCANCRKNACKRQRDHRSKSKGPRSTKDRAIIPLEDSHVSHGLEDSGMTWKNMHRRGAGATDRSGARVELLAWAEPIIAGVQVLEDHAQPIMTDTQVELQESEINLSFYTRTAANSDTSLSSLAGQVLGSAFDINPSQSERYAARNKKAVSPMHSASPTRGDISHGHFEPSPDLASCYNFLPGCDTGGSINTWALNDSYRSTPESGDSSLPSVQSSPWATGPTPASDANHLHYSENDYLIATEQPSLPALWEMEFNQAISGGCQKEPPHEFNPDSSPGSFPLDDLLEPQSDYLVQGSQYIGGSGF